MQRRIIRCGFSVWLFVLLIGCAFAAPADELRIKLSTGIDISSGDYGGTEDIDDIYVPLTATANYGRFGFRLTVPYLQVEGPAGTTVTGIGSGTGTGTGGGGGGGITPGSGGTTTESGVGDVVGSVTLYDVVRHRDLGLALDLTGKIKFGSADEKKGLGTGENDYTLQADLYKFFDRVVLFGSVGYRLRGDPPAIDLNNVWTAAGGGAYRFTSATRAGAILDFRKSAVAGADDILEFTGYVTQRLNERWSLQVYALSGLSDSSADWGGGFLVKLSL